MNLKDRFESVSPAIPFQKPRIVKRSAGLYVCESECHHEHRRVIHCGYGISPRDAYSAWYVSQPIIYEVR